MTQMLIYGCKGFLWESVTHLHHSNKDIWTPGNGRPFENGENFCCEQD